MENFINTQQRFVLGQDKQVPSFDLVIKEGGRLGQLNIRRRALYRNPNKRIKEQRCLGKEGHMRLHYTRSPKVRSGNDLQSTERTSKIRSSSNNENTEQSVCLRVHIHM